MMNDEFRSIHRYTLWFINNLSQESQYIHHSSFIIHHSSFIIPLFLLSQQILRLPYPVFLEYFARTDTQSPGKGNDGVVVPAADLGEGVNAERTEFLLGHGGNSFNNFQVVG